MSVAVVLLRGRLGHVVWDDPAAVLGDIWLISVR